MEREKIEALEGRIDTEVQKALGRIGEGDLGDYASIEGVVNGANFARNLTAGIHPDSDYIFLVLAALWRQLGAANAVLSRYEKWEAELILADEAWKGGSRPMLSQEALDDFVAIQGPRNDVLRHWRAVNFIEVEQLPEVAR